MVLPFRDFINNLVGQPVVPAPPLAAPVQPPPVATPQQYPQQQGPGIPTQQYMTPPQQEMRQQAIQREQQIAQQPLVGPAPMTPQQFAQQQGPTPPQAQQAPQTDLGGTWVTVQYQHGGITYTMLMPEANAMNLPQGATIIPNGTITDEPERVQRAVEAGENGVRGDNFIGTLAQAPEEVQGVFRSSEDVNRVGQQRPVERSIPTDEDGVPIPYDEIQDTGDWQTTQVPQVNAQGQDANAVQDDQQDFNQMIANVNRNGVDQAITLENAGPPLTTEALRAMESEVPGSAAKAAMLEEAGIFEVRADQMVVRGRDGVLRLAPYSDTVPEGMEIITYGGDTEKPEKQGMADMFGTVMEVLEKPKRFTQDLVADAAMFYAEHTGGSGTAFLTGALGNSPMGDAGLTGFAQWIVENEEAARNAQENGYTAPNGETFTGNRAMWELFQSERNIVERAIDDVTSDPLNVLPTAGAPLRGAANRIGGIRRGIGYTDEAVEATNPAINTGRRTAEEVLTSPVTAEQAATRGIQVADDAANTVARSADDIAQSTFANAPDDFARAPLVTNQGDAIVNRGRGYIDESFQNNPRTGELITDTPITRPTSVTDAVLGTTENILNTAADILDIPENILGVMVDRGIITLRQVGEWVAKIPAPDGRNVGDMFRTTDDTIVRDVLEEGEIQTQNVLRQGEDVPLGPTATDLVEPPAPRSATDEIPTAPTATGQQPLDTSALGREAEPLPTDRPIDDLGRPADEAVDRAAQPLAVDRPLQSPEEIATARNAEFLNTPAGQAAKRRLDSWPEKYAYMRPQTAMDRDVGAGRLDEAFTLRPADAAYELAPDRPEQYQRFITDYDRAVNRKTTGYFAQEDARRATKAADLNLTSKRFADQRERGLDVRNMWEVINEADHLVNNELPLFNKYFGDAVDAPEYQWKRWGTAGNSHTAMDLLEQNGGRYVEGMPLGEATEVAIFHPDDATRLSAIEDITRRIANRDDAGREIPSRLHSSISHVAGIKNVLSRSRRERRSILNLRDNYQSALQANREMPKTPLPTRDVPVAPARQAVPQLDAEPITPAVVDDGGEEVFARDLDPEGAAVYDENLRQSLDQERREARPTSDLIQDAPPVPQGAAARQNRKYTELDRNTELLDLRKLVDFRNKGQRNLDTTPLSMRERRQQSRREFLDARADTRQQTIQATGERMNETDLASFYVRGRAVSESQARYFTQKFSDGETLAARWDRYTLEEMEHVPNGDVRMAEGLAASRVINDYVAEVMPQKMRTVYDRELNKLRGRRKELEDGTSRTRTELEAQLDAMQKARSTAPNNRFLRGYDRFVSALRQTFLYNWLTGPRYIATQIAGNTITAGVTKNLDVAGDIISGKALRETWYSARNAGEIKSSMLDEVLDGYGLGGQRDITRGTPAIRDQTLEAASNELSRKGGNSLLGKYTNPIADRRIRDMAGAYDRVARESLFAHYMGNNLLVPRSALRDRMMASVPAGMDAADVARIFDEMPSRFSSTDLREAYTGAPNKWIDRHARDWQEALVKTDKAARDEVKRVFFDGSERNADRFFKRTLFFHYWMSRAVPLYTEAIARDPVMLYNFSKLLDTMEGDDSLQDSKLLKVMQSPMGYNILIRPTAFFETFATLMEDGGYTPEGESRLGALLRNSPIMVNPLIQGGLNIAGAMGDTFAPDLVGANKFLQFGGSAVDVLNAEFGWDLPSPRNLQEDTLRNARTFVSQYTGDITGFNEIPYTDARGYQENEVRSIVAEIALERGLDLDDPIVQDAMINPESEMYREAFKRSAYQDAWDIAARIIPVTAILYPKSQLASPRERAQQIGQNRESEQQLGIGTTQATSDLYTERSLIAADSERSRSMQIWQDEYRNIGTPEQRGAYRFYNNIRFGSVENPIVISGKRYAPEAVNGMEDAERTALADTWASETGNAERIETYQEERKAFREEHPEYAEYVGWQAQQRDFPGGVEAYWQDLIEGNPNAARYYNGLTEEQRQNDMNLTSLDAYFAFQGENLNYYEPEPIATRTQTPPGPYNPIDGEGGSSSSESSGTGQSRTPTRETISEQALEYQQEMDAYNAQASEILGHPIVVDQINPMARNAVVQNLEQAGISRPRMGGNLYGYMQWAEAQGGGDTTIDSYLRWYEQQNPPQAEETPAA